MFLGVLHSLRARRTLGLSELKGLLQQNVDPGDPALGCVPLTGELVQPSLASEPLSVRAVGMSLVAPLLQLPEPLHVYQLKEVEQSGLLLHR